MFDVKKIKRYFGEYWNIVDLAMYLLLAIAIVLRFALTDDKEFVAVRYVYVLDIILFYQRILQLYSIHKRLGPKVVVIFRMVCLWNRIILPRKNTSVCILVLSVSPSRIVFFLL